MRRSPRNPERTGKIMQGNWMLRWEIEFIPFFLKHAKSKFARALKITNDK
jgi:hypothetical protein